MTRDVPIVRSLLENDLYKFTMWQALLHSHPAAEAEYRFVCRNHPAFPLRDLLWRNSMKSSTTYAGSLSVKTNSITYEACASSRATSSTSCPCSTFSDVSYGPGRRVTSCTWSPRGRWCTSWVSRFSCLYVVSELYFRRLPGGSAFEQVVDERLTKKLDLLRTHEAELNVESDAQGAFSFFDFGLRRRHSARCSRSRGHPLA